MKAALRSTLTALAVAGLLVSLPAGAQRATWVDVLAPDGRSVEGMALNNLGQVVGSAYPGTDLYLERAFSWTAAAGFVDLGAPDGGSSQAVAVNDRGQIAGNSVTSGGYRSAFIVQPGQTQRSVLPGLMQSAVAINGPGTVLGLDPSGQPMWVRGGYAEPVGVLISGQKPSRLVALNDRDMLAGSVDGLALGPTPFTWSAAAGASTPALGLGVYGTAWAMNNSGAVAGVLTPFFSASGHAFATAGGPPTDLTPDLDGRSAALGINDAGMVVGWAAPKGANARAQLWLNGRSVDLNTLAGLGDQNAAAMAVNAAAQVLLLLSGATEAGTRVLTLHPDWQGGDGSWAASAGWNFGGAGPLALAPGAVHDVVIGPAGSATVRGAALAEVRSLWVGGAVGEVATLDLAGGTTRTSAGTQLAARAVLTGSGRLAGPLTVDGGARIDVGAGQRMQLGGGTVDLSGSVRVAGGGAALEVAGGLFNHAVAEIRVTQGSATFAGAVTNEGRILASGAELNFAGGLVNAGQLAVSFGATGVAGAIENRGLIVVSNGAQASFAGAIANTGELRVSAGGAANFFGMVGGGGRITGGGTARFEGGLSASGIVTVDPGSVLGAAAVTTLALDGADALAFSQAVQIEGGALMVSWAGAADARPGERWDLFDWRGGVSGRFDSLQLPTLGSGLRWDTSALYASGEIGITAVPEPAAWLLLGMGLPVLLRRRFAR